jgi:hypothetical protein
MPSPPVVSILTKRKTVKKRVFKEGDVVYCIAKRYVTKCDYVYTFDTALKELAVEAGMSQAEVNGLISHNQLREDIFQRNPKFEKNRGELRDALRNVQESLGLLETVGHIGEIEIYHGRGWYSHTVRRIVGDMAYARLKEHIKEGNERKLFFENLSPTLDYRFPRIKVAGKKTVVTGTYYPAECYRDYDGESDCVPAGLANPKRNILLAAEYGFAGCRVSDTMYGIQAMDKSLLSGLWVLADDCVYEDDLKMVDKLMEDPAKIRAAV